MVFSARIWQQQQIGYVPHTSVGGEVWSKIKNGTATSNGAAAGTTIIDTNGDSSGADAYNGLYWVKILTGTCAEEWARVVDDNGSGTLTLENAGFSAQIDSGVEYEIWQSPEPVVVVDASGSATSVTDATRVETTDFWKGYYLVPITGTQRGRIGQITASNSGTGVLTIDGTLNGSVGVTAALAAGDVCLLRKYFEGAVQWGATEAYHPRPNNRANFALADGTIGARGGSLTITTHAYPSAALAASGSKATASVLSGLFQAAGFAETVDTSSTVGAGSNTTDIKIATGSHENHTIGGAVVWNGNLRWITDKADGAAGVDTITVTPALPVAPAAADVLYATRLYAKTVTGDELGCVVEWEVDGIRHTATGCKGNLTVQAGDPIQLAWAFSVDHYVEQAEAAPYNPAGAYTTAAPILESDRQCWLSATATNIEGATFSLNATTTPRNVQGSTGINGRSGHQLTNVAATATFRELLDSSAATLPQLGRWLQRTAKDLIVLMGSHGRAFSFRLPAARHIEHTAIEDASGLVATRSAFQAQDSGAASWDSTGDSTDDTVTKVPDAAIVIS